MRAREPIAIGVAGCGYFGRFHALKIASAPDARLAGVTDPNEDRAAALAQETGSPALSWTELLAASDAIIVAAPVGAHFPLAKAALLGGRHVLVEKPIAATPTQADALATLAAERARVLQVGHLERFSAAFAALTALHPHPLYIEATRAAAFKLRGTDVSVVLDLMIHDLDLTLALLDHPVAALDAFGLALASAHEDFANARIRFADGAVASLTANRVAEKTERRMQLVERERSITLDFAAKSLSVIARGEEGEPLPAMPGFRLRQSHWSDHDALAAEHAAFRAAIRGEARVLVDAGAGSRALALALRIEAAMARRRAELKPELVPHPAPAERFP